MASPTGSGTVTTASAATAAMIAGATGVAAGRSARGPIRRRSAQPEGPDPGTPAPLGSVARRSEADVLQGGANQMGRRWPLCGPSSTRCELRRSRTPLPDAAAGDKGRWSASTPAPLGSVARRSEADVLQGGAKQMGRRWPLCGPSSTRCELRRSRTPLPDAAAGGRSRRPQQETRGAGVRGGSVGRRVCVCVSSEVPPMKSS